jgi:hypothetical protein
MVGSVPVHSYPSTSWYSSSSPGTFYFRCPSCLNVLATESRLASTAAPCPLCTAHIVAPTPLAHGVPLATLADGPTAPFTPRQPAAPAASHSRPAGPHQKVILVDGAINQAHLQRKDAMTTVKMIVLSILTAGICLAAAWLLHSGS